MSWPGDTIFRAERFVFYFISKLFGNLVVYVRTHQGAANLLDTVRYIELCDAVVAA
jgi:hypothetical protein